MSINKVTIVGIKGFKGSGKDTVASMISYILHDGIMKANYDTWLLYHKNRFVENDEIIIHFADKLKEDIAGFCNIDRKLLDKQEIKENYYYNFKTGIVSTSTKEVLYVIDNWNDVILKYDDLASYLVLYSNNVSIKIRVLLQYYGGKIIRVDRRVNNDNHESEQIKISQDDYVIDNTGTLVGLFYKVLKFVTDYMV